MYYDMITVTWSSRAANQIITYWYCSLKKYFKFRKNRHINHTDAMHEFRFLKKYHSSFQIQSHFSLEWFRFFGRKEKKGYFFPLFHKGFIIFLTYLAIYICVCIVVKHIHVNVFFCDQIMLSQDVTKYYTNFMHTCY